MLSLQKDYQKSLKSLASWNFNLFCGARQPDKEPDFSFASRSHQIALFKHKANVMQRVSGVDTLIGTLILVESRRVQHIIMQIQEKE